MEIFARTEHMLTLGDRLADIIFFAHTTTRVMFSTRFFAVYELLRVTLCVYNTIGYLIMVTELPQNRVFKCVVKKTTQIF